MFIRHFHIDRFGVLAGQQVEDLAPGLNVFLGDNEAGKSTCRDFLRAMFFGYKRGGRKGQLDYNQTNSARTAAGGGGLLLEIGGRPDQRERPAPSRLLRLLRSPGKHGGELTLYDEQGRELPQSLWQTLLSGVTADLYDKVFAFDLQDLASLESMEGQQVSAALHGAAFGTGFRSPAEVLQELEKARKDLFSPSATAKTMPINKIVRRLREIRSRIKENGSDIERHAALSVEESGLLLELEERRLARESLGRDLARTESLLGAWELWEGLSRLETELALRPHPGGEFGPDSLARLEALCAERAEKLAALEAREEELTGLEQLLDEERPPADLLRLEPLCRALAPERDNAALALRGLPELEAEAESLRREQEKILTGLGARSDEAAPAKLSIVPSDFPSDSPPGAGFSPASGGPAWSRASVLRFDCSLAARERVESLRGALNAAALEAEQCRRDQERLERDLAGAALEEARLRKARGLSGPDEAQSAAAFGPEMRLLLEEKGRDLERARQAAAENGKARLLLEREEARLKAALEGRRKEISALEKITCRAEDLEERRQDLAGLRRAADQAGAEAAEAARLAEAAAASRPALFSFTPLRRDPRRAAMALLSLGLAAFLLRPALVFLTEQSPPAIDGQAAVLGIFGLAGLWSAVFWLFPGLAAFGLYRQAPGALQVRRSECLNRLAGLEREALRRLERLNAWLPEVLRLTPQPFADGAPGLEAGPQTVLPLLPPFYRRLESFFSAQQEQLLRLQLLRLQENQDAELAAALADRLLEARQAERASEADLARELADWESGLAPYGLNRTCPPDAALQIFDRAWRCAELRAALHEAGRQLEAKRAGLRAAEAAWGAWLAETPFPPGSGPAGVLDSFVPLARFKELQAELEQRQARARQWRDELAVFDRELRKLLDGLEESREDFLRRAGAAESAVQLFDRLSAGTADALRREAVQRQRRRDLRSLQSRRTEARAALTECEASLRRLFSLAGLDEGVEFLQGAEEYRLRFANYREHRELRLEKDRLDRQLEQRAAAPLASPAQSAPRPGGGRAPAWETTAEFRRALAAADLESLTAAREELREKYAAAGQAREERLTRLGEVRAGLSALAEGEGNAALRREEAGLREELERLARRWSALTLAQAFIMQAKRSFEEERQDLVVRQAGDFFRAMTLERYRGLLFDLDKGAGLKASAVQADSAAGQSFGLTLDSKEALSRGTREQLYLALRLAYVRQHNQSRESLPLIMDDILVNFDPARAARTAAILAEFSKQNQVLFFTCHPQLADLLAAASETCARYRVEGGVICAQRA